MAQVKRDLICRVDLQLVEHGLFLPPRAHDAVGVREEVPGQRVEVVQDRAGRLVGRHHCDPSANSIRRCSISRTSPSLSIGTSRGVVHRTED